MADIYETTFEALMDGTLDPAAFSHKHHLGVAYVALSRFDFFEALTKTANGIRELTVKAGATNKFNATITFAFMSLIAERRLNDVFPSAEIFVERNPDLLDRATLAAIYQPERLTSQMAREIPLLPL